MRVENLGITDGQFDTIKEKRVLWLRLVQTRIKVNIFRVYTMKTNPTRFGAIDLCKLDQ